MRGIQRLVHRLLLPQFFMVCSTVVLTVGAVWPLQTVPAVAVHQVRAFVLPAAYAEPKPPKIVTKTPVARPVPDCNVVKCIALSFDDGPNGVTPQVLDTLERTNTAATFFVVGRNVAGHENLLRRMYLDGFEIGNHTYNHPDMTKLTPQQIDTELSMTQDAIQNAGVPRPTLFRPPYGSINAAATDKQDLQIALWNEDPRDWAVTDSAQIVAKVVSDARPGGVVDMHDIHPVTSAALPGIIDQLRAQQYHFVTVSQLLHSRDRPGNAPFYGYKDETPLN